MNICLLFALGRVAPKKHGEIPRLKTLLKIPFGLCAYSDESGEIGGPGGAGAARGRHRLARSCQQPVEAAFGGVVAAVVPGAMVAKLLAIQWEQPVESHCL